MRVLNIEDNAFKYSNISKALKRCGVAEIERAANLKVANEKIQQCKDGKSTYDLIITDMYFPVAPGGQEAKSGEMLIERVKELGLEIPIIVCSSVQYQMPGILGSVYYSESVDWENQLKELIQKIR